MLFDVDHAATIEDLRLLAKRRLPTLAFLPADIGSGDGGGPRRNIAAFEPYRLVPVVPEAAPQIDLTTSLFGRTYSAPFGISAIGYAGKMRAGADIALAEAAAVADIPFILSGGSVTPIERIAKAAPHLWQQLYLARDKAINDDFLRRGMDCGVEVLVVTVDMPSAPLPDWLTTSGIKLPISVRADAWPSLIWQLVTHPGWCVQHARHGGMPKLESWARYANGKVTTADLVRFYLSQIVPGVTWRDLEVIRKQWPGKLVIKGLLCPGDVKRAFEIGADGVTISNHGGNKTETTIPSLEALHSVAQDATLKLAGLILFDGGIRSGSDIIISKALGADFSFVGRAALYGVMAGGRRGALRAIEILRSQVARSLLQLGRGSMQEIDEECLYRRDER